MDIGIIGVNYKSADLTYRENLVKNLEKIQFSKFWHPFSKVIVNTCNRLEVYFHSPELTEAHSHLLHDFTREFNQKSHYKLYSYFGKDCFEHLAKVTAGLDSAIFAETEIQGQVKNAYIKAHQSGLCSKELHFLFQKSLKIGKDMRSLISNEKKSHGLVQTILGLNKNLKKFYKKPKILFIGASKINLQIIKCLSKIDYEIYLANRTFEKTLQYSKELLVKPFLWQEIENWDQFDGVVLATKCHEYLINKNQKEIKSEKLIIDLSVPRNACPQMNLDPYIKLLNIDQVSKMVKKNQKVQNQKTLEVEKLIQKAVIKQKQIFDLKRNPYKFEQSAY